MRPVRMNLSQVKITQLKAAADLVTDSDFERPRSGAHFGAEVTLFCQIVYDTFQRMAMSRGGNTGSSLGHLVFRKSYLDGLGIVLKPGDKIVAVWEGGATFKTVAFRLNEVMPTAHLPTPGTYTVFFEHDREERATP